ncbi:uncharacterized protein LOC6536908 isoform X1 [Drosophila yakuba]|uniref:Uncharacterized protein, isoform B n=2 Tax=Drosophila yakuba TaxID=7245 RepID=B4PPW2_DROYA|nr:uncharacterized protein LOC6536908 isoform X1 [Drosophila yakuba]EDW97189.2 uncharacterized protein Dyak_GE26243, isoform B [Drosophila yakuba]
MVAPSKILEPPLNRLHCAILHSLPGQSCTKALLWNLYRNHVSSAKYYSPLLLLPLLMNWRKVSKNLVLSVFKNYAQSVGFAAWINAITFFLMCVGRRLTDRFVFILIPYLPCWIASQLSWLMPPQVLHFFVTGITPAALETLMRYFNIGLVHSPMAQTVIFMISSVVVLHYQQSRKYSGFWFIRPASLPDNNEDWTILRHMKQGLKELRSYLGIGLAMDLLNPLMKRNLKLLRPKMTSFLAGYIGLFKVVQLLSFKRLNANQANGLAAFISGASFALLPNRLTFMSFAVVTAIQVIWSQVCDTKDEKDAVLSVMRKIPWARLLIPCSLAYLVHIFFYHQRLLNEVARSFIDCTCDNNGQRLLNLIALPNVNAILEAVDKTPKTSFWF